MTVLLSGLLFKNPSIEMHENSLLIPTACDKTWEVHGLGVSLKQPGRSAPWGKRVYWDVEILAKSSVPPLAVPCSVPQIKFNKFVLTWSPSWE